MKISRMVSVLLAVGVIGCGPSTASNDVSSTTSQTAPATSGHSTSATTTVTTAQLPTSTTTTLGPGSSASADRAVSTFQHIDGTYRPSDPGGIGFLWIIDDETLMWAPNESEERIAFSAMFQGTSVLLTDPDCGDDVVGEYEFRLRDNTDLVVVLIDDPCSGRAGLLPGVYADSG